MLTRQRNRPRKELDLTSWFLGGTILALALLDLCIWASLWNVPNPVSELLGTEAAHASSFHHAATQGPPFH